MEPMDLVLYMLVPLNLTKLLSMDKFRAVALMNFSIFESKQILLEDSYLKTWKPDHIESLTIVVALIPSSSLVYVRNVRFTIFSRAWSRLVLITLHTRPALD